MENGDLKYSHDDHLAVVERLFEINEMFHLLGPNVEEFSMEEMARKVIPRTLHSKCKLKFIDTAERMREVKTPSQRSWKIPSIISTQSMKKSWNFAARTEIANITTIEVKKVTTRRKAHKTRGSRTHVASTTSNTSGRIAQTTLPTRIARRRVKLALWRLTRRRLLSYDSGQMWRSRAR
jgi:hypothetical protein